MLEILGVIVYSTVVRCLPALLALAAWREGARSLLRKFDPRRVWVLAGPVVAGVALLLYATVRLVEGDEPANIFVLAVASMCAVLLVTASAVVFRSGSPRARVIVAGGASLVGLYGGLALGLVLYLFIWHPRE